MGSGTGYGGQVVHLVLCIVIMGLSCATLLNRYAQLGNSSRTPAITARVQA